MTGVYAARGGPVKVQALLLRSFHLYTCEPRHEPRTSAGNKHICPVSRWPRGSRARSEVARAEEVRKEAEMQQALEAQRAAERAAERASLVPRG